MFTGDKKHTHVANTQKKTRPYKCLKGVGKQNKQTNKLTNLSLIKNLGLFFEVRRFGMKVVIFQVCYHYCLVMVPLPICLPTWKHVSLLVSPKQRKNKMTAQRQWECSYALFEWSHQEWNDITHYKIGEQRGNIKYFQVLEKQTQKKNSVWYAE